MADWSAYILYEYMNLCSLRFFCASKKLTSQQFTLDHMTHLGCVLLCEIRELFVTEFRSAQSEGE